MSTSGAPRPAAGRVVAELGRPETGAETAARKAESSRLHRQRQTINNLVYSLLATLGIVLIIVLMVPRQAKSDVKPVDWRGIAAQAQKQNASLEPDPLASPTLPKKWTANAAELRTAGGSGVDVWHIGLISPSQQYVGLDQGFNANDTWIANTLEEVTATGATTVDGIKWVVYDNTAGQSQSKDISYGLVAQEGKSTVVLSGTAAPAEFKKVAAALSTQLKADEKAAR